MNIIGEVKTYKKYCEPFGSNLETVLKLVYNNYTNKININLEHKSCADFWRLVHENTDKLINEINVTQQLVKDSMDENMASKILIRKLNDKKNSLKRASAQYINFFGIDKDIEETANRIYELRDKTTSVKLDYQKPIQFITKHDSANTIFNMEPSIHFDILNQEFKEVLTNLKGKWILQWFYSAKVAEEYKQFNISYNYKYSDISKLGLIITN